MSYNKKILFLTSSLDQTNGWGRYSADLIDSLKDQGVEGVVYSAKDYLPEPLSHKKNYLLFPWYAFKIWRLLKDNPPQAVHALVETYAPLAMMLSWIFKCPYFLTICGSFGVKPMNFWYSRWFQKLSYRKAKKIVCISHYTQNRILQYETDANFEVIPLGVKLTATAPASNHRDRRIIGVGAVKKRKGFHLVIESLPLILKNIPDAEYLIVGDLSDAVYVNALKNRVQELGIANRVKFMGKISNDELVGLYKKSGVFVLTPVSDKYNFEGFGLVYLEANIFGLPVIGTYDNGGEEAIKNNHNGFLVMPGDKEGLAGCVVKILSNKDLYDTLSANAKTWAEEHTWDKIAKRYANLY